MPENSVSKIILSCAPDMVKEQTQAGANDQQELAILCGTHGLIKAQQAINSRQGLWKFFCSLSTLE